MVDTEKISKPESKEELSTGNEMILVVDDEKPLLETGEAILNQFGYDTLTAESGEVAIKIFKKDQEKIDLVLLDLVMPGIGGQKCLSELIKIKPDVKVIITSGYTASVTAQDTKIRCCGIYQ